jgi:hypothetical protein
VCYDSGVGADLIYGDRGVPTAAVAFVVDEEDRLSLSSGVESLPCSQRASPIPETTIPPDFLTPAPPFFSSESTRGSSSTRARPQPNLMFPTPPRTVTPVPSQDPPPTTTNRGKSLTRELTPSTSLTGPARTLRQRSTEPDYVRHPMDAASRWRKREKSATVSEGIPENVRGRSVLPEQKLLGASDGKKSEIRGKWPKKRINSVRCRMVGSRRT